MQRGSGGITADRTSTPATEAHVSYSEAAATEGWCCPDEVALWLETVELIPRAPSESVELENIVWRERTEPGQLEAKSQLRERDDPGWRISLALQTSRAPPNGQGTSLRHSQAIRHGSHSVACPTGIICSKLLSFLPADATGDWEDTSEGQCPGAQEPVWARERRKNEVPLVWVLIVTSCLQQRSQYPNSSIRTPETH